MAFKNRRLLLAYDPARGHCAQVVPDMKEMLEARAFEVELHQIGTSDANGLDLEAYHGLVLGTPATGSPLGSRAPSPAVLAFLEQVQGLDAVKVALFAVYGSRLGRTLETLRDVVENQGGEVVCSHAYWLGSPGHDSHVLPAECMVRIR